MALLPIPCEIPEDMRLPLYIAKREPTPLGIDRMWLNVKWDATSGKLKDELQAWAVKFNFTPIDGRSSYWAMGDLNVKNERVLDFNPHHDVPVNMTVHVHGALIAQCRLPPETDEEKQQPGAPTASNPPAPGANPPPERSER